MEITCLGHASFKLRGKTATVVTDPFDPAMVGLKYPSVEADIVTISHGHEDHNRADLVKGAKKVISGPGEYEVLGVSILGFSSWHDAQEGTLRGKNTLYVYEFEDLRLCHLGDLGHTLSDEAISQIGGLDVLLIPVGGEYTLGPKEAASLVSKVEPYLVIPMHYQVPGLNPQVFSKLFPVESFLSESGLPVEKMSKLTLKKEDIGENQGSKIILLSPK